MRILTVVGARPQFVKAAPVSHALAATPGVEEILVHTGQHFDAGMSDVFFEELSIPAPAHHLAISGGGHGAMTGRMLMALEPVAIAEKPDLLLVYGDTNSTLAGALVAAKLHIPVAHVEAGLRSFNRRMPEEVNRVVTDHLSAFLFCPTLLAIDNLRAEGITEGVWHTGDVMYDASLLAAAIAERRSDALERFGLAQREYAVATIHRAENTDDPRLLAQVLDYVRDAAGDRPVLLPLHPRTRQAAERHGVSLAGLRICEPLGYIDMTRIVSQAAVVFTDSGGLQKEAYFHRVPCVTLRGETEWVETVAAGWNRLWRGPDYRERREIGDYGTGTAARIMVDLICAHAGRANA